jgi:NAD(P)-dependent dehydrogenase (short-subunit alcohol dehydrogenase family)
MRPLREQVVLITSATQGLGRAVTRALARAGATMLLYRRDPERAWQATDNFCPRTWLPDLIEQAEEVNQEIVS